MKDAYQNLSLENLHQQVEARRMNLSSDGHSRLAGHCCANVENTSPFIRNGIGIGFWKGASVCLGDF